ncbi:hypothetical protein DWV00_10915 [Trinickia dinghuensis]|uniref:Uncharacterized protein n=1 Tax=Trinickia dinghuensis TaxID=2291023 RepID=A0A3D8K120_9BURK|nr:hypothetical protein DWV00_10915 [Trinickia dinghuensis]
MLTSPLGGLVARRIDQAHAGAPVPGWDGASLEQAAAHVAALVRGMNRDQLENCDEDLNVFFGAVPFSLTIPVAVAIELKWPHHIDTLPEASGRIELVRKAGQYAVLFSAERVADVLSAVNKREARG